jgi:hypothetical protein
MSSAQQQVLTRAANIGMIEVLRKRVCVVLDAAHDPQRPTAPLRKGMRLHVFRDQHDGQSASNRSGTCGHQQRQISKARQTSIGSAFVLRPPEAHECAAGVKCSAGLKDQRNPAIILVPLISCRLVTTPAALSLGGGPPATPMSSENHPC